MRLVDLGLVLHNQNLHVTRQDLKSRRIFEDLSRNFQQAQAAARAANQQRLQAGQVFGQLGRGVSGIGGAMAGLGAQTQALQGRDVSQLLGIGGLQQQQAQQRIGHRNS